MTRFLPSLPIIVPVDEIVHTPEHPQCDDLRCPCQDEVEDEIILSMPTEEQLDAQEQSVLGPRRIDWNRIFDDGAQALRDRDQERNILQKSADGSWW